MSVITNINKDYAFRVAVDYVESIISIKFESEIAYQQQFDNIATKHANWVYKNQYDHPKKQSFVGANLTTPSKLHITVYLCDHAGKPKEKKKRRKKALFVCLILI